MDPNQETVTMTARIGGGSLLSLKQFVAKHEACTIGTLTQLIFQRREYYTSQQGVAANKVESALVWDGRRPLIDEEKFFQWLEAEHQKAPYS
jgi:hypothetical protein